MNEFVRLDEDGFPSLPTLTARWAPIYLEPIHNSGERLTVAVLIKTGKQAQIRSVLRPDAIRMLYGQRAAGVRGLVELAVDSLDAHLKAGKSPTSWKAPISGFYSGKFQDAASSSIEGIVAQAIQRSASLSSLSMIELTKEEKLAEAESVNTRLVERVRGVLTERKKIDLLPYFNQAGKLVHDGQPVRFGFLGRGVLAHFSQLRPARLHDSQFNARARLWELSRAHEVAQLPHACLILQIPRKHDINFTSEEIQNVHSAFGDLANEALSEKLSVIEIHDEKEGADQILRLVA